MSHVRLVRATGGAAARAPVLACAPECEVLIGDPGERLGDAQVAGRSSADHDLGRADRHEARLISGQWVHTILTRHGGVR